MFKIIIVTTIDSIVLLDQILEIIGRIILNKIVLDRRIKPLDSIGKTLHKIILEQVKTKAQGSLGNQSLIYQGNLEMPPNNLNQWK